MIEIHTSTYISKLRIAAQYISDTKFSTVEEVIRSLGAVQAQDYNHALWAVGLRMRSGTTATDVVKALKNGKILRTWSIRGTLHFILPEDAKWMLRLAGPSIVAKLTSKVWRYHGTTEKMMTLARTTIVKSLTTNRYLTRKEIISLLKSVGIPNNKQQSYFILSYLCQTGVLCLGPPQDKDQTFVLLDEWATHQRKLTYEESLIELARRFFTGHGPATIADFANWTGIKADEAKSGFDSVKDDLVKEIVGTTEYWLSPNSKLGSGNFLLPAYDEFLIGYKDRSPSFQVYGKVAIATYNGMFYPTLIDNGQVAGLWKRTIGKNKIDIELQPITSIDPDLYHSHAERLGKFLGKPVNFRTRKYAEPSTRGWRKNSHS